MATFIPGLRLCQRFYREAVRPLLEEHFPSLPHTAARVGPGSDVLGFDTERSVDHDWGPRLNLFLTESDAARHTESISAMLSERLPKRVHGWPTHFVPPDTRIRSMAYTDGPVAHRVEITDFTAWTDGQLGFDPRAGVGLRDWLATPTQRLAEVTGGAVYHDGIGDLTVARRRLAWYPEDVWRYVLAAQWTRVAQEEAFVGRAAEAGDDLGSRVVTARLVRDLMRLYLLQDRRYPPYSKWLGTAFAALPGIDPVAAALGAAIGADDPDRRQAALCDAYEAAVRRQNELGLSDPVEATRRPYYDRPFPVIDAGRVATALTDRIADPRLAALPAIGAIDQYVDSTDALGPITIARSLAVGLPEAVHR